MPVDSGDVASLDSGRKTTPATVRRTEAADATGASGARMDREALVRLIFLRAILGLGAAVAFGSGTAVAVMHAGVVAAVVGAVALAIVTGWFAVRANHGSGLLVARLERVLPAARSARPERLLPTVRVARG